MITFLRLASLGTAAVWLGGTVLFVFGVDPLFGRAEVVRLLGPLHAGETGLLMAERFHLFQWICAGVAVVLTCIDWLYTGRSLEMRVLGLLGLLLLLAGFGRLWVVPHCRDLNRQAFLGPNRQVQRQALTPAQRQAENSLRVWQGVGVLVDVIGLAGTIVYFVLAGSSSNASPRLFPKARLRI